MTKREYQSLPRELASGLRRLDLRVRGLAALRGMGVFCSVVGAALAVSLLADWLIAPGVAVRVGLLAGAVIMAVMTLAVAVVRPLLRRTSASELAALVDAAYPELGERIESAVELADESLPEQHRGSRLMRQQLLEEAVRQSQSVDFGAAAEPRSALRWATVGGVTLVLLLAPFGLSRDGYALLLRRFLTPWQNLERATNLYFVIENGDRAVPRGSDVTIEAQPRWRVAETSLPDHAWLHWRGRDGKTDSRRMAFDATTGTFRATIPHVLAAFDYEVSAGAVRTRTYHIDVVEAPQIDRLRVKIAPPAYTGRPARQLDGPIGRIEAFERSRLSFSVEFNKPVASAALQWLDREPGARVPAEAGDSSEAEGLEDASFTLAEDGRSGTLTLTAEHGGPFTITLRDEQDVANFDREPWELVIISDAPPVIEWADGGPALREPASAIDVRPDDRLPLPVVAADDVGVVELELHAEVLQRREKLQPLIAESPDMGAARIRYDFSWDLSPLGLKNGDLLTVRGRAVDGRPVPGPQEAWTSPRLVRITADAESVEKTLLAQEQQRLREILESMRANVQQDRATTESLRKTAREAIGDDQPPDQRQEITNLAERERTLTERLEQLAAVFEEHPLQRNIAEPTRAVGSGPLDAARAQFQQAASSPPQEQLEQLTKAADELNRADHQLEQLLKRFDELAALEQDLQRLQQLAEDAERLSNDVADFEKQWEQLTQAQELANELRKQRTNELAAQHEELQIDQQALAGALDRLLEERPEVLQAATEHQLRRLRELSEHASRLAEREERLAEVLEQEQTSADQSSDVEPAADSDGTPPSPADPAMVAESSAKTDDTAERSDETPQPAAQTNSRDSDRTNDTDPSQPEDSAARQQQQLAEHAARLALDTARNRGVESPSAQQARQFAEQSLQAAEDAGTGLVDDAAEAAEKAAEAARQAAEQMQNPTDPAPGPLREQAEALAQQQAAIAEQLRQQTQSPDARQQAQAEGQRRLSEQTAALAEQLEVIAERLGSEPLNESDESGRAGSARQSATNAQSEMQTAAQELQQGRTSGAAPHARAAAESLRTAAQQAGPTQSSPAQNEESPAQGEESPAQDQAAQTQNEGENGSQSQEQNSQSEGTNEGSQPGTKPAENPSGQSSPVPGEVGVQVADARRMLQRAGEQLQKNGPRSQRTESSELTESEGQPPADQPDASPSEDDAADSPEGAEDQPMPEGETPGEQPSKGEPQTQPTELADQNASQSMKQVAESLRQAARQLGMAPSSSDSNGKPGEQEGEPSDGAPGSQSGNSGKNPISLMELETELKRMSSRNWGQLPGRVESDLIQSTQRQPAEDYARLIRLYFEEISRRRSAAENLVPDDNE